MRTITFKDYKKAIREHYKKVSIDDVSGILADPSPAQLRNLCTIILDKGISKKEEEIFRLFFKTKETETLKRSIDNCNIDKFRPIISFLKGTESENNIRIEMTAIITNFKPRPYSEFSKNGGIPVDDKPTDYIVIPTDSDMFGQEKEEEPLDGGLPLVKKPDEKIVNPKREIKTWPKGWNVAIWIAGAFIVTMSVYGVKNTLFKEKECMQWVGDHYERVDCINRENTVIYQKKPEPYNEVEFLRKKIKVSDTTTFYKNGKAIVWYSKKDGIVEFFNMDGENPDNGCELKRISQHMINEYVKL